MDNDPLDFEEEYVPVSAGSFTALSDKVSGYRKEPSPLVTKSFEWAVQTASIMRSHYGSPFERHFAHQVVRSATAVAAAVEEANSAVSGRDFIYKFKHALKEANESKLWLKMVYRLGFADTEHIRTVLELGNEVRYMLASSITTYQRNHPDPRK